MREAEGGARRAVEVLPGLDPVGCCQASSGLSVRSVVPLQALAWRGERLAGWQAAAEP